MNVWHDAWQRVRSSYRFIVKTVSYLVIFRKEGENIEGREKRKDRPELWKPHILVEETQEKRKAYNKEGQ